MFEISGKKDSPFWNTINTINIGKHIFVYSGLLNQKWSCNMKWYSWYFSLYLTQYWRYHRQTIRVKTLKGNTWYLIYSSWMIECDLECTNHFLASKPLSFILILYVLQYKKLFNEIYNRIFIFIQKQFCWPSFVI